MCKKLIFLISLFLVFALLGTNACFAGTIDVRVSSGNNDAEEDLGDNSIDLTSTDLELVKDGSTNQIIGLRFTGINIAQGTTINSAYVEFEVDALPAGSSDAVNVVINGELAENAAAITATASDLSGRALTTAKANWSIPAATAVDEKLQSADITAVIQEIVDQAGWAAGNSLVLLIRDDAGSPSVGTRETESYNGEAAAAPLLHIEFEGEAPTEPTVNEIWFEAENADPLVAPMETYYDDPCASGGGYMGVAAGNNSTGGSPAPDGTAHYTFNVPEAGTYKVFVRVKIETDTYDDDSAYARIDGATYSSGSDWIKWNNIYAFVDLDWQWIPIFDNDAGDADVEFTMDAGEYDLEIAYREDGLYFDAILITDDLTLNPATLPDAVPGGSALYAPLNRYSFDDGDTAAVDSIGGKDGTLEGAASISGNNLVLDGSSAAYLPSDVLDPGLESLTIEGWVELGSSATWARLFDFGGSSGSDGGNTFYLVPNNNSNNMQLTISTTGFPSWQTGEESIYADGLVVGVPTHIACVFDGSVPEFRLYQNGELKASAPTTMDLSAVARENAYIGDSSYSGDPGFIGSVDEFRIYDIALTDDDVLASFTAGPDAELGGAAPPAIVKATKPMPENGTTDLTRFNLLSWTPGDYADSHNVYLGTDRQAVTDAKADDPMGVLVSQQQTDAFYMASGDYGTTYYWRIDEVNEADSTIYPGNVWSFSTKPIGLIVPQSSIKATASSQKDADQDPNKTIDGSGLNAQNQHGTDNTTMWLSDTTNAPDKAWIRYDFDKLYKMPRMLIWNHNLTGFSAGYAMKSVTIEYSSDGGDNWTVLEDPNELPQGTGTDTLEPVIVDLGGVADGLAINAFRITANSNYRSAFKNYGLSEVKFYYIPVWPTNPNPADDATGVSVVNPKLTWTAGEGVVEHKVFFGTDEQAVTNGTAASSVVADTSFTPPPLTLGTVYYWRVVEVNMASVPSEWSGPTWSFATSVYTVVDDFESYGSSINKWSSGSSSSGNGAAISLDTAIANGGSQSMKFMFDDTSTNGYSETSANPGQLNSGSNWTTGSPQWLVFYVYGDLANIKTEKLYVKLNDAMYWYQQDLIADSELVTPWWTQVQVPLIANQVSLNNVSSIKIGFIRTDFNTGTGVINVDDIRLYKDAPTPIVPVNPGDANLVARYKMENNVNDSSANGIDGTILGDPQFVSHEYSGYGKALAFDANEDVVDLGPADPFNFTGSFTISLWANIEDWGSEWGSAMAATRGEGSEGFQVRRGGGWIAGLQGKTGEGLSFTTRGISLEGIRISEDMIVDPPALGRWTHIVCIYDMENSVKKVYFDSKLIQESATPEGATLGPASQNASLGARANSGNTGFEALFTGKLDEVRFYNKALTEAEVRYLSDPTP
jgi:hypothetical protein